MAKVKPQRLFFRLVEGTDVSDIAKVRVRVHEANTEPSYDGEYQDFDMPEASADGKYYIPVDEVDALTDFEGEADFAISFLDEVGNESAMLDKDAGVFDQRPPNPPAEVGLE
jgi:hypothetical protein